MCDFPKGIEIETCVRSIGKHLQLQIQKRQSLTSVGPRQFPWERAPPHADGKRPSKNGGLVRYNSDWLIVAELK